MEALYPYPYPYPYPYLYLYLYILLLFCLLQYPTAFSLMNKNTSSNHVCFEDESQMLLQFKQHLSPAHPEKYYKTKYWSGRWDCCLWDGVTCDDFTGHVIALDLSYSDYHFSYLNGKLKSNSSLFHLAHLQSLNLAFNNFTGSAIPSEFARFNALAHLNLSGAAFAGEIPMEFYHLSNLVSLDLAFSNYNYGDMIKCDVKMLFGNMTRLRVLVLKFQNLSNSELPKNMSSFLTHLDLGGSGLQGKLPATIFEKPNLQILDLSYNGGLVGSLPKSFNWSNVHSIQELHLTGTNISGRVPDSIGLMTNLKLMDLSKCRFWGPIPESIGNITGITFIDLSQNDFNDRLPSTISNLVHLSYLDLSHNHLEGQLPNAFSGLQNLANLDLANNYLEGRIPSSLSNMSQLTHMDMSSNNLTGRVGKLISKALNFLDLSSNVGLNIELESFYKLTEIEELKISYTTVTKHGDDGDIVNVTLPNLGNLEMSSCEIKEFPNFLRSNMPSLDILDLSNNNIHGPIPSWFTSSHSWQGPRYLDLHSNSIQGTFPISICNMSELEYLYLSDNKLSGNIPTTIEAMYYLSDLKLNGNHLEGPLPPSLCNISDLYILSLSDNKLTGNILECLANSSYLEVLDLKRNEFHGKIPTTIGGSLINLGLNGNHLEGTLPPSLANSTALEVIDLGNNMLQDTFPWWLHTLPKLKILILKSNSFHGSITSPAFTNNSFSNLQILDLSHNNFTGLLPEKIFASLKAIRYWSQPSSSDYLYMRTDMGYEFSVILTVKGAVMEYTKVLKIFNTIDLSSNHFIGSIPDSLSYLTSLRLLNLSHNNISGNIPPALGRMTNLEQLDLSSNQLAGGIPQTLTNLKFLEVLDLSHNHLVGPIPVGNQFSTFLNESYAGNSGLCGAPLTRSCGDEREPTSAGEFEDEDEEDDGFMMGFTWKVVVIGYGCGIVMGFILGNVMMFMEKPRWLVRFVYVEAAIILRRRNKRRRRMVQGRR